MATAGERFAPPLELTADETNYRLLAACISDYALVFLDSGGNIASWNIGASALTGYPQEAIIGRHVSLLYPQKERLSGRPQLEMATAGREGRFHDEGWYVRSDGSQFRAEISMIARRDQAGRLHGFALVMRDLTQPLLVRNRTAELERTIAELRAEMDERIRVEAALLESHAKIDRLTETRTRLATIVESSHDAVATADLNFVLTSWNRGAEQLYGYAADEVIGGPSSILIPEDRMAEFQFLCERLRRGEHIESLDNEHLRKDGQRIAVSISAFSIENDVGKVEIAMIARDLSKQRAAETALRFSEERLRAFNSRMLTMREDERTRISRDIHDIFGQTLTVMKLDLACVAHVARDLIPTRHDVAERLTSIAASLDTMIRSTRELATQLRPGILDAVGLIPTIEWELREFEARTGIRTRLESSVEHFDLDDAKATAAYRILQEALTNTARHAGARNVQVTVLADETILNLRIADDGQGVAESALQDIRSLGLLGMHERARLAGGTLTIGRAETGGTLVTLVLDATAEANP